MEHILAQGQTGDFGVHFSGQQKGQKIMQELVCDFFAVGDQIYAGDRGIVLENGVTDLQQGRRVQAGFSAGGRDVADTGQSGKELVQQCGVKVAVHGVAAHTVGAGHVAPAGGFDA